VAIWDSIREGLGWVLAFFYSIIPNSGVAIILLTVAVRLVLFPLTAKQAKSMIAMQRVQPEIKKLQAKYKNDRQKLNEEMMKFYKENKINPAASCLPLLAQAPVFISLYLVLRNFSQHVPAGSDLSWLHIVPDITAKANSVWSGYLLLVIYAGSQVLSTYFMSATMDKAQRTIMMIVPLVFITVIAHFPIGLVIYWVTTNLWTVGQGLVTRRLMPKTPAPSLFNRGARQKATPKPAAKSAPAPAVARPPKAAETPKQPAQPRPVRRKKQGGSRR
jgi:YidC/Oxa1 family membrane protein insertase